MEDKFRKVLFEYHSPVLNKTVKETMWAIEIDQTAGIYQLDSIPFYGAPIATSDEFRAIFDKTERILVFESLVKPSGNSIVLIIVTKDNYDKEELRQTFRALQCDSEGLNERYFSMEVPKEVDYALVKNKLDGYQFDEIINYAEPCLSQKHKDDIQNLN